MLLERKIFEEIDDALKKAFDSELPAHPRLDAPPERTMGDFAFACFPLAGALKRSPHDIAKQLAAFISGGDIIENAEASGPYLNLTLAKEVLFRLTCEEILADPEHFGTSSVGNNQRILVEYSAPNTNKPQHLGHVRNNLLGMAVSNLLEAIGFDVIKVNLVNDRGVHICKSMLAYLEFGGGSSPESTGKKGDHFVGEYYVRYEKQQQEEWRDWLSRKGLQQDMLDDKELKRREAEFLSESCWYARAKELLQKWEQGDREVVQLWRRMNDWVYRGFDETYARLGCTFEKTYYESETYTLGRHLVEEGLKKKLFYRKDDGSIWVDLTDQKLGEKLLLRSDGTSVYMTQDIGTTKLKFDDFHMRRAVWIVGDEQIHHFKVLFALMKKLGFEWAEGCYHLAYGMIDLPEGKMKSREGTVVDADELMDELCDLEKAEILQRQLDIAPSELEKTAEILAMGALKFFILKFGPQTRMLFDPAESISFDGFTGPYVQYAYVRIRSIFRKSGDDEYRSVRADKCNFGVLVQQEEIALVRKLHDFPNEVTAAALAYNPSRLTAYLYELAREFSKFYHEHSVLQAETEELKYARLVLAKATGIALQRGLQLLGINVPERM